MAGHTPGPWARDAVKAHIVKTPFVGDTIVVNTGEEGFEGDVRLIASAPELLEACEVAFLQLPKNNHHYAETGQGTQELFQDNGHAWKTLCDVLMKVHPYKYVSELKEALQAKAMGE